METVFHALLGSQGRIYIPKAVVERYELWEGTPINVTITITILKYRESSFPTTVRKGWVFTVPKRERVFHQLRRRKPLKISISRS